MSEQWVVPHPGARRIPIGSRGARNGDPIIGLRENLPEPPTVITYTTSHDRQCPLILAGVRCPFPRGHSMPCGGRFRTETGLDFYVAWEPVQVHDRRFVPPAVVQLLDDLERVWSFAVCGICGNGVEPAERPEFLRFGAHPLCLADEARDNDIHFDAEERL